MNTGINTGIYIEGNGGNNSTYVVGSTQTQVNINSIPESSEALVNIDAEFERLIREYQLTKEQISELKGSLEEFKAYMETQEPRKSTAQILLGNVKNVFSAMISNSEAIERFIGLGQKMIDLWK